MTGRIGSMTVGGQKVDVTEFTCYTATPTDGEALLAAILARPAEDTPRLLYADWLDERAMERGEPLPTPRAEFIRAQCERDARIREIKSRGEGMWPQEDAASVARLENREAELLAFDWRPVEIPRTSCRIRKLPPTIEILDGDGFRAGFEFRRGFVASVKCSAADWLAFADALLAAHPVRRVTLTTIPDLKHSAHQARLGGDTRWFHDRVIGDELRRLIAEGAPTDLSDEQVILGLRWPGVTFDLPP